MGGVAQVLEPEPPQAAGGAPPSLVASCGCAAQVREPELPVRADSRSPTAFRKRFFLAGFCRENREIDFYAPKLPRRVSVEIRFLGETVRIKTQKAAEYCQPTAEATFLPRLVFSKDSQDVLCAQRRFALQNSPRPRSFFSRGDKPSPP
jgi:hypothetical protein